MANNPYLENNPYLNGYSFDENENSKTDSDKETNNLDSLVTNQEEVNETNKSTSTKKTSKKPEPQKEFDILDASTFINADPKISEDKGEPYKEIKQKNKKQKEIKVKEKKKFSFKSFFLGFFLAVVMLVSTLGITISSLYNSLTISKIQSMLNTNLTDGELNDYTIKDLVSLLQDYNAITIGNLENLLGFNLNEMSEDVAWGDLLNELSQTYLNKGYRQVKITEAQNSLNTIINELTIDHFAKILIATKENGELKYFKEELLSKGVCETIITCFAGKNVKFITFFGEEIGSNLNNINVGTLVKKIFIINENSSKFEKFLYNAFENNTYGIYDLVKNYNEVIDSSIQIKDIVNSFIEENTTDAFLNIIKTTYSNNTSGVTSFIDNFSEELNEIKLHTIVTNLWPDLNDENLNTSYDGFIKLIYDIYSNPENNIGVMDFANNISAQLNYIKIDNVIKAFLNGDSKIEKFIQSVYGNYSDVGFGDFIDNFMNNYINDISVKNIIETFLESDNDFVKFLISIYTTEKYDEIGVSEFIDGFVDNYSKDITLDKVLSFIMPKDPTNQQPFEKLILDLWGDNTSDLFTVFSDLKAFVDEVYIKDFVNTLYENDIITKELYLTFMASICNSVDNILNNNGQIIYENIVVLEEFETMGTYSYFTNINKYINNITLQEILNNTQNLPEILVKLIELLGEKGILDFIENPLEIISKITIREISELYFETSEEHNNKIPASFNNILNIIIEEAIIGQPNHENNKPAKLLGDLTANEFLNNRNTYFNKVAVNHLLEFLVENKTLKITENNSSDNGLKQGFYDFLKDNFGNYGLVDFKNNASTIIEKITVNSLIDTLDKTGSLKGLKESKNTYLITFIKDKFGELEIKNFFDDFTNHLNSVTIIDLRDYIDNSSDFEKDGNGKIKNKTYRIFFDIIDTITNKIIENNANNFSLYLQNELTTSSITFEESKLIAIVEAYKTNSLDKYVFENETEKEFVLNTEKEFNDRINSKEYGTNELRLHSFIEGLFTNVTNLKIEDLCNIFEVKLEAENGEKLSIYGQLLNKIKNNTLQEFLDNAETILEDSLTSVVKETTIGEVQSAFDINLLQIFKCYNTETPISELLEGFNSLTIGDIIGTTSSNLLRNFTKIKLSEIADTENGFEAIINGLSLGEFVKISKVIKEINLYPNQSELNEYFKDKYIEGTFTGTTDKIYYIYNTTTGLFETTTDIDDKTSILGVTNINEEEILKSIKSSLNIYSEITLDRYYIYENNILTQVVSTHEKVTDAKNNSTLKTLESFEGVTLENGSVYNITGASGDKYSNKYYRYNFDSKTWEKASYQNAKYTYTANAFDEVLKFKKANDELKDIPNSDYIKLLSNDAVKINGFYMVFDGELFDSFDNFTENSKLLCLLKHTNISEIGTSINNLTVGDVFGEHSKIVKLVGGDATIKLSELENSINIASLTLQELGDIGLLDITNVKEVYLSQTVQDILNSVLKKD